MPHLSWRPGLLRAISFMGLLGFLVSFSLFSAEIPLRIERVKPSPISFTETDPALIFHDEFNTAPSQNPAYLEVTSETPDSFIRIPEGGLPDGAMRARFDKGQVTVGTLKLAFGKKSFSQGQGLRRDETFREIYWRLYVKHEAGWEGNPAKLARATCLVSANWTQGFIAHVWGGKDDCLCIDPATGILENQVATTKYNDFDHLKWLGCRNGKTPIFSAAESGRWVCIESHIKLNTPGQADGIFELWVDGKLEAAHDDLNWHGTWLDYAINAVFVENYWNDGSPKVQSRWFDDFVVSTKPIGPLTAARPIVLNRTRATEAIPWEVEIASDPEGRSILWKSLPIPASATEITADGTTGHFTDSSVTSLPPANNSTYWARVRPIGQENWSPWHFPFH